MRCLMVYYSLSGQAERAVAEASATCVAAGWEVATCRIDFGDPAIRLHRPLTVGAVKHWVDHSKAGTVFPLEYTPTEAVQGEYDLILVVSNTWASSPSAPIRSFIEGPEAKRLLQGKKFGVYIVCRKLWKDNLAIMRKLGEAAGGTYVGGEAFTNAGNQVTSMIQTVTYLMRGGDPLRSLLGIPLPDYGLSAKALARLPGFTKELLGASTA